MMFRPIFKGSTGLPLDSNATDAPPWNIMALDDIEVTLDSDAPSLLQEEMKKLSSSVRFIEKGFKTRISSLTWTFRAIFLASSTKPANLRARWSTFSETYLKIVWESRRIAGNARTTAKDFAGDFIDMIRDETQSYEGKKKEIAEYRKFLEKDIDDATNLLRSFKKLRTDVVQFSHDVHISSRHYSFWNVKMNRLMHEIEETNKSLEKEKMLVIDGTARGLGLRFVTGGLIAIGVLCPSLWLKSVVLLGQDAACAHEHWKQYQQLSEKRCKLQMQLKNHSDSGESTRSTRLTFASLQYEMDLALEKFTSLERLWHFICSDLDAIESILEPEPSSKENVHFHRRVQIVSRAYHILADALRVYETNVDD